MEWMRSALYAGIILLAVIVWVARRLFFPPPIDLPHPPGHWLFGGTTALRAAQGKVYMVLNKWQDLCGPRFAVRVIGRRVAVFADPTDIRSILLDRNTFHRNDNFREAFQLFSNGLLVLDGDVWHTHRKFVQPIFSPDNLREACTITNNVVDKLLTRWERIRTSDTPAIQLHHDFSATAMDVIGMFAFDQNFNSVDNPNDHMSELINKGTMYLSRRINTPKFLWGVLLNDQKEAAECLVAIREFVLRVIKDRQESINTGPKRRTLLDMLLESRKQGDEGVMTDEEIKDEILMMFLAGHETTANTACWVIYALSEEPEIVAKVLEEVDRVLGGGIPSYDDLSELHYLEKVIKESLRLYPVAPLTGRKVTKRTVVHETVLPMGTNVICNFYHVHRNEKYWPNATKFDPERFNNDAKIVPGTYVPFGDGPKNCVGRALAMMEMKTLLARIFQKYTLKVKDRDQVDFTFSVTLGPKHGMYVELTPRK